MPTLAIPRADTKIVTIAGSPEAVAVAKALVERIVSGLTFVEIPLAEGDATALLGLGGEIAKEIERLSGAKMSIAEPSANSAGKLQRIVTIHGEPGAVAKAKSIVAKKVAENTSFEMQVISGFRFREFPRKFNQFPRPGFLLFFSGKFREIIF